MKKNIIALAIASAIAAPVVMADAPTVYGQMNLAIDVVNENGSDVVHRNSRLGFKGAEDLGNGLKAVYQMEATVNYSLINMNRNTFVGLAGSFGTVVMGRHDTPLRMIQPSDGFADSAYAGNNTSKFNGGLAGEDRLDEVVAYISPSFNGITFAGAITGQDSLKKVSTPAKADDDKITNAMTFSLSYGSKAKGLYLAAGLTDTEASVRGDITRFVAQYGVDGLTASAMYNKQDKVGSSTTVGVAYKMGEMTPRAKVSMVSYDAAGSKDATNFALGLDYALGKKTNTYVEYALLDKNNTAGANFATAKETSVLSVGMLHKF